MTNIFIIGSKGIPAQYGGFETFVDQLTSRRTNKSVQYHVSCLGDVNSEFYHNGARCFKIKVPDVGSGKAVLYDLLSLKECYDYIKLHNLAHTQCIVYILACRIGPFISFYKRKLKRMGVRVFVNPDGNEWKRSKWNRLIRWYWKLSERLMIKHADMLICDSVGIEHYIQEEYHDYSPKTTYIAYGADCYPSILSNRDKLLQEWYQRFDVKANEYYLIVGRFVPENNYEYIINEYLSTNSKKDLVIISNIEQNKFYHDLLNRTQFCNDKRIKFVGTVYDQELLKKIRELAYGYIHGHEVGGTNPSLLEAMAMTKVNLLLDVVFNKEVGREAALYFSKTKGSLKSLLKITDQLHPEEITILEQKSKRRILQQYSWNKIIHEYEELFVGTSGKRVEKSVYRQVVGIK